MSKEVYLKLTYIDMFPNSLILALEIMIDKSQMKKQKGGLGGAELQ